MRDRHGNPWISITLLLIAGSISLTPPSAGAQQEAPLPDQQDPEQELAESTEEEEISPLSDAERLLRFERIIELDQGKLDEVRRELETRQEFFDLLGQQTRDVALALEEKQDQRREMGETADPEEVSALEAEIAELEAQVELMAAQTDLALTAESTVRKQIEALEKKLEREQRAIDMLRGVTSVDSSQSAAVPPEPTTQPTGAPAVRPGFPVIPQTPAAPESKPKITRLESTAQIEAIRELERMEAEVARAELDVVEFVKRKESLQQQIGFEETLRETAEGSVENLSRAVEVFEGILQAKTKAGAEQEELKYLQEGIESITELAAESQGEIERRTEYIESLQARLNRTQAEEDLVVQEVEDRREDAKRALEKLFWLESPLHPKNVWRWLSSRGPRILLVIIVAWVLLAIVRWSARWIAQTIVGAPDKESSRGTNRADTLALSFRSAVSLFIVIAAVLLVFQEAGVDVKTVLGGAAILGVGLAFGAQNLMRDYFTGFMILLEDQYELGDLITIGGITGTVERVNMRTTMLRDIEGRMHFIPNGEIKSVTNRTYVWGRAVLELPIPFSEDVDRVMDVIQQVAKDFREDPEMGDWVTDEPVMLGVDKFTEYGVIIKFMVQTQPDKIFPTRRQLLRRIKNRFDQEGIEISVPHRILIQPSGEDHSS